jgi:hypothetical protein
VPFFASVSDAGRIRDGRRIAGRALGTRRPPGLSLKCLETQGETLRKRTERERRLAQESILLAEVRDFLIALDRPCYAPPRLHVSTSVEIS